MKLSSRFRGATKWIFTNLLGFGVLVFTTAFVAATGQAAQAERVVGWGYNFYGQASPPAGLTNVAVLAAGGDHSLALLADGTVVGWGNNDIGQASPPPSLNGVVDIVASTSQRHSLALRSDGTVVGWGNNAQGQLDVPAGLTDVVAIGAGGLHSLAVRRDGTVVAWGYNSHGQTDVPLELTNVVSVTGGGDFSLALKGDGTVVGWGNSQNTNLHFPPGLTGVVAIATRQHTLALKSDGTVVAWGLNDWGQRDVPAGLSNVVAIGVGFGHSLALKQDGILVAWGYNGSGQGAVPAGLSGVVAIAAGGNHNLALAVNPPINPPVLINQPQGIVTNTGAVVTFSVLATGTGPLTYQWRKNGTNLIGETDATLAFNNAQPSDSGSYNVIVGNAGGSVTSAVATLTVVLPPTLVAQPQSGSVYARSFFFFEVMTTGDAPLSYQWFKDGVAITGATSRLIVFNNAQATSAGSYHAAVSNAGGSVTSAPAVLTFLGPPPAGTLVALGGYDPPPGLDDVVAVDASATHCLALRSNGTVVAWGNSFFTQGATNVPAGLSDVVAISAGAGYSLALKADGTVVGWGPKSGANVPDGLFGVVAIAAGDRFSLAIKADGTYARWGSSGQPLPPGLSNLVSAAAAWDTCWVLRNDGTVFVASPSPVPITLSNIVAISLKGDSPSVYGLALKSDGTEINNPSGPSNLVAVAAGPNYGLGLKSDGTVVGFLGAGTVGGMTNVTAIAAGGGFGLVVSTWPVITQHPQGATVQPGSDYTFTVTAKGAGPFTYQWRKNGADIPGATGTSLTLSSVQAVGPGDYMVIVSNIAGSVVSLPATLQLFGMPIITSQPQSKTVFAGAKVAFSVAAIGANPLSYQWQRSGAPISGATDSTLTIDSVQSGDAGVYSVIVSNTVGPVTSAAASLVITTRPPLSLSPPGTVISLNAGAVPPGLMSVVAVAAGYSHSLALKSDGTVVAWGDNRLSACDVPLGLSNVVSIAASESGSVALRGDGTIVSWGIGGATYVPPELYGVTAISAGNRHGLALLSDGTVVGWGATRGAAVPSWLTNVTTIDAGYESSIALLSDGRVVLWGLLPWPEDGTVGSGISNAVAVSAGQAYHLIALDDGTVVAPVSGIEPRTSFVSVLGGGTGVVAVGAGWQYGLVLQNDGKVVSLAGTPPPAGLTNVTAISVNSSFGLAISTTPPPPVLSAASSGSNIMILQPVSVSGYVLETADDPSYPYVEVSGYTNSFIYVGASGPGFTMPIEGTVRFFRLKKR